ncbi:MAG: DNA/RNA helicase domain-containing protein [Flavobacteriales bacterium]
MANGAKPSAPAVFLSGNKPLVDVLQYEMRCAGGEGKVFVQNVKDFVKRYSNKKSIAPPHHVLIFDEAQRAWSSSCAPEA